MANRRLFLCLLLALTTQVWADIPFMIPDPPDPYITTEALEHKLKLTPDQAWLCQSYLKAVYLEERREEQLWAGSKRSMTSQSSIEVNPHFRKLALLKSQEQMLKKRLQKLGVTPMEREEIKPGQSSLDPSLERPVVGSSHLLALLFLSSGALLGLRRMLSNPNRGE